MQASFHTSSVASLSNHSPITDRSLGLRNEVTRIFKFIYQIQKKTIIFQLIRC
jgi:hypothetical protein